MHTVNESIQVGALSIRFLVAPGESGGSASVFECLVPASAKVPTPHSHDAFEETVYGLAGTSTWTIDGQTTALRPGEAVCIRRGAIHAFENRGDEDTRFLAMATPGVMRPEYFRELHDLLAPGGPPAPADVAAVMRRHGLTPAPPVAA
jgi:quercetin dioxygenase-like cupin family protein